MTSLDRLLEIAIADQDIHGAAMVATNKSGQYNSLLIDKVQKIIRIFLTSMVRGVKYRHSQL
jgi:hypothetical protein